MNFPVYAHESSFGIYALLVVGVGNANRLIRSAGYLEVFPSHAWEIRRIPEKLPKNRPTIKYFLVPL
jgi:hypothetical protein